MHISVLYNILYIMNYNRIIRMLKYINHLLSMTSTVIIRYYSVLHKHIYIYG